MDRLKQYQDETRGMDATEVLAWGITTFGRDTITLASSFGAEDQVLTAMQAGINAKARIFTLDTGRLFEETYEVWDATQRKYGIQFEVKFPERLEIKKLVEEKGPNLFRNSVAERKSCCEVRKMQPLRKVLSTVYCWITGLRQAQSVTRTDMELIEWDDNFNIYKINPLVAWSEEQVWDYIKNNDVPYNSLHDKGFPSIGCQPCTRPIQKGEDVRAGRWWWEAPEHKECGLHFKGDNVVRNNK